MGRRSQSEHRPHALTVERTPLQPQVAASATVRLAEDGIGLPASSSYPWPCPVAWDTAATKSCRHPASKLDAYDAARQALHHTPSCIHTTSTCPPPRGRPPYPFSGSYPLSALHDIALLCTIVISLALSSALFFLLWDHGFLFSPASYHGPILVIRHTFSDRCCSVLMYLHLSYLRCI